MRQLILVGLISALALSAERPQTKEQPVPGAPDQEQQYGSAKVRADLQKSRKRTGNVNVAITGSMTGEPLSVDSIEIQS
jgi:hypothetical protein